MNPASKFVTKCVYADGTPVQPGICRETDHHVSTFSVEIRHMSRLNAEKLKDLIQKQFEVVACEQTGNTIVVR